MAKHVKCKDMSVTAHTKTHQYVILNILSIIMRRKIKENNVHMLCHRPYYALVGIVSVIVGQDIYAASAWNALWF